MNNSTLGITTPLFKFDVLGLDHRRIRYHIRAVSHEAASRCFDDLLAHNHATEPHKARLVCIQLV